MPTVARKRQFRLAANVYRNPLFFQAFWGGGEEIGRMVAEAVSTRLSPLERARRYRQLARETLRLAEQATKPELRATFLSLSACWASLAREAENAGRFASLIDNVSP
jgi:hypothetical protein